MDSSLLSEYSFWWVAGVVVVAAVAGWLLWEWLTDPPRQKYGHRLRQPGLPPSADRNIPAGNPGLNFGSKLSEIDQRVRRLQDDVREIKTPQTQVFRLDSIEQRLKRLEVRSEGAVPGVNRPAFGGPDQRLSERVLRLENQLACMETLLQPRVTPPLEPSSSAAAARDARRMSPEIPAPELVPPMQIESWRQSELPMDDLDSVGRRILAQIAPQGRASDLARFPALTGWLSRNHPRIKAAHVGSETQGVWLLVVLSYDGRTGIAIPAIDSVIGPGEIRNWFGGDGYDGTQPLSLHQVRSFAKAACDPESETWRPQEKGRIDLDAER